MSGTRSRSYISGIDPANSLSVATIGLLRSAGRGGDRLHDIVHHILADPTAHVAAHAGREPVVEAGPDARVRDPRRPAIFDRNGAARDPAVLRQPLLEGDGPWTVGRRRAGAEEADGGELGRLLCARCERPAQRTCERRAAEERDKLAPSQRAVPHASQSSSKHMIPRRMTRDSRAAIQLPVYLT